MRDLPARPISHEAAAVRARVRLAWPSGHTPKFASDLPRSKGGGFARSSQASAALLLPLKRRPRGGREETKR